VTAEATASARVDGPASASASTSGRGARPGSAGGLAWLVGVGSLAFFATAQYCRQLYDDTFYALYAGRFLAGHGIPRRNVFTVIAHGAPWIDQQWLAQLTYYGLWRLGGYAAVVMLSLALVSVGFALLGALMLRRGVSPLRMSAWTLAAMAVSYGYATPRAQSFGYLFVPLVLFLVLADQGRRRPCTVTWLSFPLLVVWANMHGSVLVGAGFVGVHAAYRSWAALRRRDRRCLAWYLLLGVSAAGSVICTPYGFGILHYYGSLIGNRVVAGNGGEWAPPSPVLSYCWAFYAVLIAVVGAVIVGWRRGTRPNPELAAFTVVTLVMAQLAFRNVPWFGFTGCLLAADMLRARPASPAMPAAFRRVLAAGLAACALLAATALGQEPMRQYEAWIPRRAIDVAAHLAAQDPALRMLSDQWPAAGMLWLHPSMFGRVAFDVRDEQYSQSEIAEVFAFIAADRPHWQRALQGYNLVVVSRHWHPYLADAMSRMAGWRVVYADASGVVLERAH
jgi:hypothetical protein